MKTKSFKILFASLLLLNCVSVFAADIGAGDGGIGAGNNNTKDVAATSSTLGLNIQIVNPINDVDIFSLIDRIVGMVLKVGIPIIALFLLWAGFQYVAARGNQSKITEAHRNLGHVLLGTAIFLGAYTITKAIIATVDLITK